jgi:hypothetical protein
LVHEKNFNSHQGFRACSFVIADRIHEIVFAMEVVCRLIACPKSYVIYFQRYISFGWIRNYSAGFEIEETVVIEIVAADIEAVNAGIFLRQKLISKNERILIFRVRVVIFRCSCTDENEAQRQDEEAEDEVNLSAK